MINSSLQSTWTHQSWHTMASHRKIFINLKYCTRTPLPEAAIAEPPRGNVPLVWKPRSATRCQSSPGSPAASLQGDPARHGALGTLWQLQAVLHTARGGKLVQKSLLTHGKTAFRSSKINRSKPMNITNSCAGLTSITAVFVFGILEGLGLLAAWEVCLGQGAGRNAAVPNHFTCGHRLGSHLHYCLGKLTDWLCAGDPSMSFQDANAVNGIIALICGTRN